MIVLSNYPEFICGCKKKIKQLVEHAPEINKPGMIIK